VKLLMQSLCTAIGAFAGVPSGKEKLIGPFAVSTVGRPFNFRAQYATAPETTQEK
jgi:hypothetical protein